MVALSAIQSDSCRQLETFFHDYSAQRLEILRLLDRLSELTPDVRFGQLLVNLSYLAVAPTTVAIWDMEDGQLIAAIHRHLADLADRTVNIA